MHRISSCDLFRLLDSQVPSSNRWLRISNVTSPLALPPAARSLPSSMGRLTRLVSLNLCDNQLRDLPVSMGYCTGIENFHIERNPIESQEVSVCVWYCVALFVFFFSKSIFISLICRFAPCCVYCEVDPIPPSIPFIYPTILFIIDLFTPYFLHLCFLLTSAASSCTDPQQVCDGQ